MENQPDNFIEETEKESKIWSLELLDEMEACLEHLYDQEYIAYSTGERFFSIRLKQIEDERFKLANVLQSW